MSPRSIIELTPETPIRMSAGRFWTVLTSVSGVVFAGAVYGTSLLKDIRDELKDLNTAVSQSWTTEDHVRWANQLDKSNRGINLVVPDVYEIRSSRSEKK